MNARVVSGGELTPEQKRVHRVEHILRRDGGSPGSALEGLASIVEDETWRKVPSSPEDPRPFTSFRKFVAANPPYGLGYSVTQLRALLQLAHPGEDAAAIHERMEAMRAVVNELLRDDVQPMLPHGGDRRSTEFQDNDATLKFPSGRGSEYVVSRLKKEDPDLAERVIKGEVTVTSAARQKGWRKPVVTLTSPESIARALRRHLGSEDLAALIQHLLGES